MVSINQSHWLARAELLLGKDGVAKLSTCRVALFGVGGVGSWCAEALVRSGIRQLTLVDGDCVEVSNINRQLPAEPECVGQPKAEVLARRLRRLSPEAEVESRVLFYSADTAAALPLEPFDWVVDAIDSVPSKCLLAERALALGKGFCSSMGAALKRDPTLIRRAPLSRVTSCRLAKAVRTEFKRRGVSLDYPCVYSLERPQAAAGRGSLVQVTAPFGFALAGLVIDSVAG